MKTPDLFYRVQFEKPYEVDDGHGGTETGWDTLHPVRARANFRFLRGGETVQAARLQGRQPVVVTVRKDSDVMKVTAGWRMRGDRQNEGGPDDASVIYNVRAAPVPSDDRRYVEILVEGGVAV